MARTFALFTAHNSDAISTGAGRAERAVRLPLPLSLSLPFMARRWADTRAAHLPSASVAGVLSAGGDAGGGPGARWLAHPPWSEAERMRGGRRGATDGAQGGSVADDRPPRGRAGPEGKRTTR